MFRHKHRADEIPDFPRFLDYIEQNDPELFKRYHQQLKIALIGDILVFIFFLGAIAFIVGALFFLLMNPYALLELIALLIAGGAFFAGVIAASVIGRRGHAGAIRVESEIVSAFHKSGFS